MSKKLLQTAALAVFLIPALSFAAAGKGKTGCPSLISGVELRVVGTSDNLNLTVGTRIIASQALLDLFPASQNPDDVYFVFEKQLMADPVGNQDTMKSQFNSGYSTTTLTMQINPQFAKYFCSLPAMPLSFKPMASNPAVLNQMNQGQQDILGGILNLPQADQTLWFQALAYIQNQYLGSSVKNADGSGGGGGQKPNVSFNGFTKALGKGWNEGKDIGKTVGCTLGNATCEKFGDFADAAVSTVAAPTLAAGSGFAYLAIGVYNDIVQRPGILEQIGNIFNRN